MLQIETIQRESKLKETNLYPTHLGVWSHLIINLLLLFDKCKLNSLASFSLFYVNSTDRSSLMSQETLPWAVGLNQNSEGVGPKLNNGDGAQRLVKRHKTIGPTMAVCN